MSFTDQKPRVATIDDTQAAWSGYQNGERFRCYLCGHKFIVGDQWRFVFGDGYINFLVCEKCDCADVQQIWKDRNEELRNKFWWFVDDYDRALHSY